MGVDFAGPIKYRQSPRVEGKAYLVRYACSLSRAMHLAVLPNQETTTFLGSFKRMVARRGRPAKVFSDNGKTFVGAARWLKQIQSDEKVQSYLSDEGIAWSFNLTRAPWWGGQFERLIGLFKRTFYKTIGGGLLSWTELSEVVLQVETQLNRRPLSYVEEDVQLPLLTPVSFLFQRSIRLPEQEPWREENVDLRRRRSSGLWKEVNQGTSQDSVSGPYLFNIFLNDLEIKNGSTTCLYKYANDSTIIAPVWRDIDCSNELVMQFLEWSKNNCMTCNPSKCKELAFVKKGNAQIFERVAGIPQVKELILLGVTFQSDTRFNTHVKNKLTKADKSLNVLRTLRREGYNQSEIDYLFNSIVLPNISYGLAVYGAAEAELTTIQCFLDRCKKRRYISHSIDIQDLLEKQDKKICTKVMGLEGHPLYNMLPEVKNTKYELRRKSAVKPKINTKRFMSSFINRLTFKYKLADLFH